MAGRAVRPGLAAVGAVRAVFDANSMNFFAVTTQSDQFKPHIRWLYDLGALGEFTYENASAEDVIQPTALMIHRGPRSSAYAEIFSVGAPGHYQGLMLGSAPNGLGNLPWDSKQQERSTANRFLQVISKPCSRRPAPSAQAPHRTPLACSWTRAP